jgi:hypothetical protein
MDQPYRMNQLLQLILCFKGCILQVQKYVQKYLILIYIILLSSAAPIGKQL